MRSDHTAAVADRPHDDHPVAAKVATTLIWLIVLALVTGFAYAALFVWGLSSTARHAEKAERVYVPALDRNAEKFSTDLQARLAAGDVSLQVVAKGRVDEIGDRAKPTANGVHVTYSISSSSLGSGPTARSNVRRCYSEDVDLTSRPPAVKHSTIGCELLIKSLAVPTLQPH